jgi:hypothetical protein
LYSSTPRVRPFVPHARTPPAALDHSLLCSTIQRSVLLEISTWTPILRVRCLPSALACLGSDVA